MKTFLASTALVIAATAAFAQTTTATQDYADDDLAASPGPETTPVIDRDAQQARTAGTIEVDHEGSGMTTQSSVDIQANRDGAPTTPMNDQEFEGTSTNVPDLDEGTVVDNPQTPATATIDGGVVESTDDAELSDADPGFVAPQIDRPGYAAMQYDETVLPQLEGVDVFDATDEQIGAIGYTVNAAASGTGRPLAILTLGGFLGLGEREVALPIDAMTFMEGEGGIRAYVDATADQLDALPEYEG